MNESTTTTTVSELTETTSLFESALSTGETEETTTVTFLPVEEQLSYVRSDLDFILGLLVAFIVIELCKWVYRFLNIFIPI